MNTGVKLILYVILVIAVMVTGILFFKNFGKLFDDSSSKAKIEAAAESQPAAAAAPTDTNIVTDTNAVAVTNVVADTNAVAAVTNSVADTNATSEAAVTNAPPETNTLATTKPPVKKAKTKKAVAAVANGQSEF